VKQANFTFVNHARIRSWNQPVLSNKDKVNCSWKQWEHLIGLELTTDRYPPITKSDALPTAPRRPLKLKLMQGIGMVIVAEKQNSSNNTNNNDSSIYSSTMTALPKFITNQQRKQQH